MFYLRSRVDVSPVSRPPSPFLPVPVSPRLPVPPSPRPLSRVSPCRVSPSPCLRVSVSPRLPFSVSPRIAMYTLQVTAVFNSAPAVMLLLRSVFFTFLLPGMVTVLIPYWLISSGGAVTFSNHGPIRYFGWPLIVIGAAGLLWCIWEFFAEGRGTLAPVDPPRHLVVRGLYKYVRNPMYVAVVTVLLGESIVFTSTGVLTEAGVFIALAYLFVVFYEEPTLRREFGESYERYLQTVGRWLPRFRSKTT